MHRPRAAGNRAEAEFVAALVDARAGGATFRALAKASGWSLAGVFKLVKRAEPSEPVR